MTRNMPSPAVRTPIAMAQPVRFLTSSYKLSAVIAISLLLIHRVSHTGQVATKHRAAQRRHAVVHWSRPVLFNFSDHGDSVRHEDSCDIVDEVLTDMCVLVVHNSA